MNGAERYAPGTHIRVRRPFGYLHHGIYLGGDQVAQFGGRVADKPAAKIGIVTLAEFEQGRPSNEVLANVVDRWSGLYLHQAGPAEEVIERAHWLVDNYPAGRYNLMGNNCETIAIWCRCGGSTESRQARGAIYTVRAFVVWPVILILLPLLKRRGKLSERRTAQAQASVFCIHLIPSFIWGWHRWRFAKYIATHHPPTIALLEQQRRKGERSQQRTG